MWAARAAATSGVSAIWAETAQAKRRTAANYLKIKKSYFLKNEIKYEIIYGFHFWKRLKIAKGMLQVTIVRLSSALYTSQELCHLRCAGIKANSFPISPYISPHQLPLPFLYFHILNDKQKTPPEQLIDSTKSQLHICTKRRFISASIICMRVTLVGYFFTDLRINSHFWGKKRKEGEALWSENPFLCKN